MRCVWGRQANLQEAKLMGGGGRGCGCWRERAMMTRGREGVQGDEVFWGVCM